MRPGRALVAKIGAAVLAGLVAVGLGLDSADAWDPSAGIVVGLVVLAAVLAAGSTIASAVAEWRRRQLGARREQAEILLTATLWAVVDLSAQSTTGAVDYRDLGIAAYRVRRIRWRSGQERLDRVHRVRARHRPASSRIDWAPGKGVIGVCVQRGEQVAQDVGAIGAALWPCTQEEWDTIVPADAKLGLTYQEFVDVHAKYEVVVATPIIDDASTSSRVVGCVALDGPEGSLATLTAQPVLDQLDAAAQGLLRQAT